MAEHRLLRRTRVRRALGSTRLRLLLCLGLVFAPGAVGTFAYWTDTAAVTTGSFTSGTLNIKVDGEDGSPATPYAWSFAATNMIPGESFAASVEVQNKGSVDFTYTAKATGVQSPATPNALLDDMRFTTYVGGTPTNTASSGGLRTGSCTGSDMGLDPLALNGTPQTAIGTAQSVTHATGTHEVCVVAALPGTAGNADQGQSVTATYLFTAKQIGAP